MDAGIDWTTWPRRLRRGWPIVALAAAAAVIVSLALALRPSERYRARAILVVAKPSTASAFDERLHDAEPDPNSPYQVPSLGAYAALAHTPALAEEVARRLEGVGAEAPAAASLLRRCRVGVQADGALIAVECRAAAPDLAAGTANAWAEAFALEMATLFASDVAGVVEARDQAAADLDRAEEALARFHGSSDLVANEIEIADMDRRWASALATVHRLDVAAAEAAELERRDAGAAGRTIAARLASLALEIGVAYAPTETVSADLVGPGLDAFGDVGAPELSGLLAALESIRDETMAAVAELPGQMAEARGDLERQRAQLRFLELDRDLARERHETLVRRADEVALQAAVDRPEVLLAARAIPPASPSYGPLIQSALAALLLGVFCGAVVALLAVRGATDG